MDELYVVSGGRGKVVVYDNTFFPTVSLGPGRGAYAPRSVYIDHEDMVFVSQGATLDRNARIGIYNPAFFPVGEITFADIPEGDNFTPRNMIIGENGFLYLTGLNTRGVLVLDEKGRFNHWLRPVDRVVVEEQEADQATLDALRNGEDQETVESVPDTSAVDDQEDESLNMADLLPPELVPNQGGAEKQEQTTTTRPVQVADIARDSEGHLYVLSEETSKIYVYSPGEELLFSFGQKGGSTGKMSRPKSLVVDEKKKAVYVVDYMRHTILIYDLGGKYMYEFGGMGTGPGWFQYPTSLELLKNGYLAVADLFNSRVQVLDVDFTYAFSLYRKRSVPGGQEQEESRGRQETRPSVPPAGQQAGDVVQPTPL